MASGRSTVAVNTNSFWPWNGFCSEVGICAEHKLSNVMVLTNATGERFAADMLKSYASISSVSSGLMLDMPRYPLALHAIRDRQRAIVAFGGHWGLKQNKQRNFYHLEVIFSSEANRYGEDEINPSSLLSKEAVHFHSHQPHVWLLVIFNPRKKY